MWKGEINKLDDYRYEIPLDKSMGMRTAGRFYTSPSGLDHIKSEDGLQQLANVATLPGIQKYSLAMPDIHWGYGFPIGGVAAFDADEGGVISPGGVGYDINCGVRLVRSNMMFKDFKDQIEEITHQMYRDIPTGVGTRGIIKVSTSELKDVCRKGAQWAVENDMGVKEDLECTEDGGFIDGADPALASERAIERGKPQLGSLGAGNHFIELQVVDKIFDTEAARVMEIEEGQITIMIHSGSRGFGYQCCDDSLAEMQKSAQKYNIELVDRQLACTPLNSKEAKDYLALMQSAANFAWCNRQIIMHAIRKGLSRKLNKSWEELGLYLLYDLAHNIAKIEEHDVYGVTKTLCVHRKGATRAFGPNNPLVTEKYRSIGQPVIIPGSMGTASYLLVGTETAMKETFGSCAHGAGRILGRRQALKQLDHTELLNEMKAKNIVVRAQSKKTLREEAPQAYKDVHAVVEASHESGIAKKVARLKPLGVIKG
ncbi:RtcB family protein [bacterium]|nr:RtcB family protein [bacterium]MBU1025341.1 RtcB family protein [bacterium]